MLLWNWNHVHNRCMYKETFGCHLFNVQFVSFYFFSQFSNVTLVMIYETKIKCQWAKRFLENYWNYEKNVQNLPQD